MGVCVGCHSLTSSASELAQKMLLSVTPDSSCEPASETETHRPQHSQEVQLSELRE